MSIGRGWYEDAVDQDETNEVRELAVSLLKEKLSDIFNIISEKHRGNYAVKEIKKQESVL